MTSYGFANGALAMNFSTKSGLQFYDAEACALGNSDERLADIPVPQALGGGKVSLELNGTRLLLTGDGLANTSLAFSVELYHSYSFLAPGSPSTLVSKNARVATSDAVTISNRDAFATLGLSSDVALRAGRYEVRGIFQSGNVISVVRTEVLLAGLSDWVWLGGCQTTPVYANDFRVAVPLGSSPGTWPRVVFLLYRAYGVEGFARVALGLNLSAVGFVKVPWSSTLAGYDVSSTPVSGISRLGVANDTIYLVASAPGAYLDYSVGLGNQSFFSGRAGPILPFTTTLIPVELSRLAVRYAVNGVVVDEAEVGVRNGNGSLTHGTTGKDGTIIFYLPAGSYTVSATNGNETSPEPVSLAKSQNLAVTLGNPVALSETPELIIGLSAAAGVGVLLNFLVLARVRKKRRHSQS